MKGIKKKGERKENFMLYYTTKKTKKRMERGKVVVSFVKDYLLKVKPLFFAAFSGVMDCPDSRRRLFSSKSKRCFSSASFIALWRA